MYFWLPLRADYVWCRDTASKSASSVSRLSRARTTGTGHEAQKAPRSQVEDGQAQLVCAFWDRPHERPTQVGHDAPALIVAAAGDPRTTYRGSVALHGLPPSSKLLTLKGANHHGLYADYGNACVDAKVNRYLATGALPPTDETCPKQAGR